MQAASFVLLPELIITGKSFPATLFVMDLLGMENAGNWQTPNSKIKLLPQATMSNCHWRSPTIAENFSKSSGLISTATFGKWHFRRLCRPLSLRHRDFDVNIGGNQCGGVS